VNRRRIGVVLVGHGSREPYHKGVISYLTKQLKKEYEFVGCAFMQINKPSIPEALEAAAEAGVEELIVQPVFLTRGVHTELDIPELLNLPRGSRLGTIELKGRKILIKYGKPIDKDDRLLEILKDRIREAMG